MDVGIGNYQLSFPDALAVQHEMRPIQGVPTFVAKVGPFELSVHFGGGNLQTLREHIGWTTKYEAEFVELRVNGIPGFSLVRSPGNTRRLDFAFQAPNAESVSLVAWANHETTDEDRELIERIVRTIKRRPQESPNTSLERTRER
jgi:hypothetical protein